jgi:hypothetical protein
VVGPNDRSQERKALRDVLEVELLRIELQAKLLAQEGADGRDCGFEALADFIDQHEVVDVAAAAFEAEHIADEDVEGMRVGVDE